MMHDILCYSWQFLWKVSNNRWGTMTRCVFCSSNSVTILVIAGFMYNIQPFVRKQTPDCSKHIIASKPTWKSHYVSHTRFQIKVFIIILKMKTLNLLLVKWSINSISLSLVPVCNCALRYIVNDGRWDTKATV